METPRFEEIDFSPRKEKREEADTKLAGEVQALREEVKREAAARTSFELKGRRVEIASERDCIVAEKLAIVEKLSALTEKKAAEGSYFEEQIAAKLLERERTALDLAIRDGELEQEFPNTAGHIMHADKAP